MELVQYINNVAEQFESARLFYGHGTDTAFDEAVYLVYGVLKINFHESVYEANRELSSQEVVNLDELVNQRIEQRIPVAYLINQAWFAGLKFYSDKRALVPRSPLAQLILCNFQPVLANEPQRVLDLCCGGGCIGIAIANQFPGARVDLADIDCAALELADTNIELHECSDRVRTIHSNLYSQIEESYDLIVCNPPYVSQQEYEELPQEYKSEPVIGLVSEQEGLQIPAQILKESAKYLSDEGLLIMEVGYSAQLLSERFSSVPFLWLEFAEGGSGVFALSRKQLEQYSVEFN